MFSNSGVGLLRTRIYKSLEGVILQGLVEGRALMEEGKGFKGRKQGCRRKKAKVLKEEGKGIEG